MTALSLKRVYRIRLVGKPAQEPLYVGTSKGGAVDTFEELIREACGVASADILMTEDGAVIARYDGKAGAKATQADVWNFVTYARLNSSKKSATVFHLWHHGDGGISSEGEAAEIMVTVPAERVELAKDALLAAFSVLWDMNVANIEVFTGEELAQRMELEECERCGLLPHPPHEECPGDPEYTVSRRRSS